MFDFFGDHLSLIFVDEFNLLELLKLFLSGNNCRLIFALQLLDERHLEQEETLRDFFEIQILGFENRADLMFVVRSYEADVGL